MEDAVSLDGKLKPFLAKSVISDDTIYVSYSLRIGLFYEMDECLGDGVEMFSLRCFR